MQSIIKKFEKASKPNAFEKAFESLDSQFENNFEDALLFLFRKSKKGRFNAYNLHQFQYFWSSPLPIKYFDQLFSSDYAEDLLEGYFSQEFLCFNKNKRKYRRIPCNQPQTNKILLKKLSESYPDLLLKNIRLNKAFLDDVHFESFTPFQDHSNKELQNFYTVISLLRDENNKVQKEKKDLQKELFKLDWLKLLSVLSFHYEEKFYQWSIDETVIAYPSDYIIWAYNDLLNNYPKDQIPSPPSTEEEIYQQHTQYLLDYTQKKYVAATESIDKLASIHYFEHDYVDNFAYDLNQTYELRKTGGMQLAPKNDRIIWDWHKDGKKLEAIDTYFNLKASEAVVNAEEREELKFPGKTEYEQEINRKTSCHHLFTGIKLDYYGLKDYKIKFDLAKLCAQQETFSSNCKMRHSDALLAVYPQITLEQFWKKYALISGKNMLAKGTFGALRFDTKNDLSLFEENKSANETKNRLDFVTHNIANRNDRLDLYFHTFIKWGDYYISFKTLVANRNWGNSLVNRLLNKELTNRNKENNALEENLAEKFKNVGFEAINSYNIIKPDKDTLGELDTVVYQDNTLLLIELKTTYIRSSFVQISGHEKMLDKAARQLHRNKKYLDNNPKAAQELLDKLKIDKSWDELKVESLIVSSSIEYDHQKFNGITKISLFELYRLLEDDKAYFEYSFLFHFSKKDLRKKMVSYYKNGFSLPTLLDAIKEDKVWSFLNPFIQYDRQKHEQPLSTKEATFEDVILFNKGCVAYDKDQNFVLAEQYFRKAIALEPTAEYYTSLGNALGDQGKLQESIEMYTKSLELCPNNAHTLGNRAVSYMQSGELFKALTDFNKAIELHPSFTFLYLNRAMVNTHLGIYDTARKDLNYGLKLAKLHGNKQDEAKAKEMLALLNSRWGL